MSGEHIGDCRGGGYAMVAQKCIKCRRFIRPANRKIKIEDARWLRERTGAGIRECKDALLLYGLLGRAKEYLQCAGYAILAKCGNFEPADDGETWMRQCTCRRVERSETWQPYPFEYCSECGAYLGDSNIGDHCPKCEAEVVG